ncbi:hypothetical protein [Dokdonella sp.]|uniref:hypothetical protein n=1 Tax=Dokdonella sp. TaxID=2291710 RepID=UPI0035277141
MLVGACARGVKTDATMAPVNIPASFDVTLLAAKEYQFDYQDVPLTQESLRAALNYRKDQSLPMSTVLLKRGEKQKVTDRHIAELAQISVALGFTAFVQDDDEINEIRTTIKDN